VPGGKGVFRQAELENSGAGRALAPGGGQMPLGGLGLFRQAVLADASGGRASGHELCVLFLTDNDVLLGSGDVVP